MRNPQLSRALNHVALARKSLSLAASDLAVLRYRGVAPIGEAGDELTIELERVCDLAHELERCATNLSEVSGEGWPFIGGRGPIRAERTGHSPD